MDMDVVENDPKYFSIVDKLTSRDVRIIDDDEMFEMWLSIEVDRLARYICILLK
jgi:hypothetical protein